MPTSKGKSMHDHIIDLVDEALVLLEKEFLRHPTYFYTEHDLASRAYGLIHERLRTYVVRGTDKKIHTLVHHEYPTPFKCSMKGHTFSIQDEDSEFRRGHYDIVVFNPDFLRKCSHVAARGQDFKVFKEEWKSVAVEPAILVGIELMYNRQTRHSDNWWKEVKQDYKKLQRSKRVVDSGDRIEEGSERLEDSGRLFMREIRVLAFDAVPSDSPKAEVPSDLKSAPKSEFKYIPSR